MGILTWHKPPKLRPTADHNAYYQSDTNVPGTYVPNMDKVWQEKFKAKFIRGAKENDPRIEIRKTQRGTRLLVVVRYAPPGLHVDLSMNSTAHFEGGEYDNLDKAIGEAYALLVEVQADENWAAKGEVRPRGPYPWEVVPSPLL